MGPLLNITTNSGQYELQVNHAKLEYDNHPLPRANVKTVQGSFQLNAEPARLRVDSYQARKSLGHLNFTDTYKEASNNAQANLSEYISDTIRIGKGVGDVTDGSTIGSLVTQKMIDMPRSMTIFIPTSGSVSISWQDSELNREYTPTEMTYDWDIKDVDFTYTRGDVSLNVVQSPNVDIKYVGEPLYFPRSAAKAYGVS